jgi:hypothetical protein
MSHKIQFRHLEIGQHFFWGGHEWVRTKEHHHGKPPACGFTNCRNVEQGYDAGFGLVTHVVPA